MHYSSSITKYRHINRPDSDLEVLDVLPIIPPRSYHHDYHREIAWTIDYRGDDDDIPTLLYVGAGYTLVKKVFLLLFANPNILVDGIRLYHEHYIYQRQGKAWQRVAVELKNFKAGVTSLESLGSIISDMMRRACLCNVRYVQLDKFLNL